MTELTLKALQVLDDTRFRYGNSPERRGTMAPASKDCCYYNPVTGARCAVGALFDQWKVRSLTIEQWEELNELTPIYDEVRRMLDEKYRDLPFTFLTLLQRWHDAGANFTETGMTDRGERGLRVIGLILTEVGAEEMDTMEHELVRLYVKLTIDGYAFINYPTDQAVLDAVHNFATSTIKS